MLAETQTAGTRTTGTDAASTDHELQVLRDNQNLGAGLIAGLVAAAVGAGIWAWITVLTEYQIGWMAVAVGLLVGFSVRKFGRGVDRVFGFMGAGLALLGCVAGNLLMACAFVARNESVALTQVLGGLDVTIAFELLSLTFSPIDLLFYGIAAYEGHQFALGRGFKSN